MTGDSTKLENNIDNDTNDLNSSNRGKFLI